MTPHQPGPDGSDIGPALELIRAAFAPMEGRIDPPSSIHRLSQSQMIAHAGRGELWVIGRPPRAAVIATPQDDALDLGKLAVAAETRGQGLARRLIVAMAGRAIELGLKRLRLQTRIELVENHATFAALGFVETGRSAHPGYGHPTSITMERPV